MTLQEFAKENGRSLEALQKALRRSGHSAPAHLLLSADHLRILSASARRGRPKKLLKNSAEADADKVSSVSAAPAAPEEPDKREKYNSVIGFLRSQAANVIAIGIVVWHSVLIATELSMLAGSVGLTAGILIMLMVLLCLFLSSEPSRFWWAGEKAFWAVMIIDVAATYLHYKSFASLLPDNKTMAISIAILVVFISISALSVYRTKNNEL